MSGERVERRLAAILAVDVAGYSRLMGEDEEGTLAASDRAEHSRLSSSPPAGGRSEGANHSGWLSSEARSRGAAPAIVTAVDKSGKVWLITTAPRRAAMA